MFSTLLNAPDQGPEHETYWCTGTRQSINRNPYHFRLRYSSTLAPATSETLRKERGPNDIFYGAILMKNPSAPRGEDKLRPSLPKSKSAALVIPTDVAAKSALDNHANQLNPNNIAYWKSRGISDPPLETFRS